MLEAQLPEGTLNTDMPSDEGDDDEDDRFSEGGRKQVHNPNKRKRKKHLKPSTSIIPKHHTQLCTPHQLDAFKGLIEYS